VTGFARPHRALLALAALATLLALGAPATALAQRALPHFADDGSMEAFTGEMITGPTAISRGGSTFVAWQGPGFDPRVAVHDDGAGAWLGPFTAGTNPLRLDTHGAPALYRDPAGRIHVFYGSHHTGLLHARSAAPDVLDAWEQLSTVASVTTYPQAIDGGEGRLDLFYRTRGVEWGDWVSVSSTDGASTFSTPTTLLASDASDLWYANFAPGSGGRIHAAWIRSDQVLARDGFSFIRYDLYYAARDAAGVWRNASGSPITVPVTRASADAECRVFASGNLTVNEVSVSEDASGRPMILHLLGAGVGPDNYAWRLVRFTGEGWTGADIARTDHPLDGGFARRTAEGLEAFLTVGVSDGTGAKDGNQRGRGGAIVRFASGDGATWSRVETITPDEGPGLFNDPRSVVDDPAGGVVFTSWTNDPSDFTQRLFLWRPGGLVSRVSSGSVERISGGGDAVATAISVSRTGFPEGAASVVLATSLDFPDALSATPLAGALQGPLLMTRPDTVTAELAAEIRRLGPARVVIVGGPGVVPEAIAARLRELGVPKVERLGGAGRHDTALQVARRLRTVDPTFRTDRAVVVSARAWPDGVTAGVLAAAMRAPVVLVERDGVPWQARAVMDEWDTAHTIVAGGTGVVATATADALPGVERVAGADRAATAVALAERGRREGLIALRPVLVAQTSFTDALVGGPLAARLRSPLLFASTALPSVTATWVVEHRGEIDRIRVVGPASRVTDAALATAGRRLEGVLVP
jgi:putative cell wall-binding protein